MSDLDMIEDFDDSDEIENQEQKQHSYLNELKHLTNQIVDRDGYLKLIRRTEEIGTGLGPEYYEILAGARTDMSVEYLLTEGMYMADLLFTRIVANSRAFI